MKILSIDVGIKNLAFCLFEKTNLDINLENINEEKKKYNNEFKIIKWDIINLTNSGNFSCCFSDKNKIIKEKEKIICSKPACLKKNDEYFCLKHAKKHPYLSIPSSQQKTGFISKCKIQKLQTIYINLVNLALNNKVNLPNDLKNKIISTDYNNFNNSNNNQLIKLKKPELCKLVNELINYLYFENIEKTKSGDVLLYEIGVSINEKFNEYLKDIDVIDNVIIENQIGPLAVRMKTIQGMLLQYFIMSKFNVKKVEFINASNKLKDLGITNEEKLKYIDRKKLSIKKCLELLLIEPRFNNYFDFFNSHKKKDDLSDAFLQGYWWINKFKNET